MVDFVEILDVLEQSLIFVDLHVFRAYIAAIFELSSLYLVDWTHLSTKVKTKLCAKVRS